MKKVFCILVIIVLFICGCSAYASPRQIGIGAEETSLVSKNTVKSKKDTGSKQKTLIAEPLNQTSAKSGSSQSASSTSIQSLDTYSKNKLTCSEPGKSGTTIVYKFSGNQDQYDIIKNYAKILGSGMNLKLVDSYEKSHTKSTYFSYAYNYTGSAKVNGNMEMQFKDSVSCDVCMWGEIRRNKMTVRINIPNSMKMADLGYRYGGTNVEVKLGGKSAYAGLYKLSDGSFQTSDGRLETKLGKATVLRDGSKTTCNANYVINKNSKEALKVYNFYRTESIYFTVPYNQLMTGDVFTTTDLKRKKNYDDPEDFNLGTAFCLNHGGSWIFPLYNDSEYKDLTVRVMYYDKGKEAVFYIYSELTTEPYVIEALCAVDLSVAKENKDAQNDSSSNSASSFNSSSSSSSASSSRSSSSGGSNSFPSTERTRCSYCNGRGTKNCLTCGGKGTVTQRGSTPNYSGKRPGSYSVTKSCPNVRCHGGQVDCSFCGGDGWR